MDAEPLRTGYSREELEAMLRRMESAADIFYSIARSGHHQFVEFTGFIREYIKICRRAMEHGVDFGTAFALPIETYEAGYLGEKFGCIFGDSFCAEPALVNHFLEAAFGVRATGFEIPERA